MGSVTTMITDKKQLIKLLSFFVMGDGGVYRKSPGPKANCFFCMNMKAENKDYIDWVVDVISNVTSVSCKERKMSNRDGFTRKPQFTVTSKSHPIFTKIREQVYTENYKGISSHYLKLIDGEALAILYMCDGNLFIEKPGRVPRLLNDSYNVTLNLKRLSEGDLILLKKILKVKFNLDFNILKQGKYRYLRLRCKDVLAFMHLVSPYILPSFRYKLIPSYRTIDPSTG
jgi:hypothetical protein